MPTQLHGRQLLDTSVPVGKLSATGTRNATTVLYGDDVFRVPATGGTTINMGSSVYADGSVPTGNTVANTAVETTMASSYTIPAGSLAVGNVLRVRMAGVHGTDVVAPTITVKVKVGSAVVGNTGSITLVAAVTNFGFSGYVDLIVTSGGASGSLEAQGFIQFATGAVSSISADMVNTAPLTAIDLTVAQAVTITVQWGMAAVANTIMMRQMEIDISKVVASGGGLITRSISPIAVNTTAGATANTDYVYICTATLTITLPTASGNTNTYVIKNVGGITTIATTSAQTIDGSTTAVISVQYTSVEVISDGTNWNII